MKLKAIIVDDEINASSNLQMMLEEYCPEVEVIGIANSAQEARQLLDEETPDVVFLDIKMPKEDGFTFLSSIEVRDFSVVFTTAHNEFALKAFKADAVDYLEKPISIDDLQRAVNKLIKIHKAGQTNVSQSSALQEFFKTAVYYPENEKTAIPTRDGLAIVSNKDILRLEACDSYTKIFMIDGRKFMSSKNIKVYEDNLNSQIFFRTHKSHIINAMYHLKAFSRNDGNVAVLTDDTCVPISRRKLPEFLDRVSSF
jgi:two-component system, LytTR family, response regulator